MKKIFYLLIFSLMLILSGVAYGNKVKEKNAANYVAKERFGNSTVGFIDFPENWAVFRDPNASPTAKQISKTPIDIITLDIVPNSDNLTAAQGIKNMENHFLQMGFPKENVKLSETTINNYKAYQISILYPDGRNLVIYLIDYDKKVYYISLEGFPDEFPNLFNVIGNSWNPKK